MAAILPDDELLLAKLLLQKYFVQASRRPLFPRRTKADFSPNPAVITQRLCGARRRAPTWSRSQMSTQILRAPNQRIAPIANANILY
jgi:hypothetical protein